MKQSIVPKPTVLMYNMGGTRGDPWRITAQQLGIQLRAVHPSEYDLEIGKLLRTGSCGKSEPVMGFLEPMLLMAFFPKGMLDIFLQTAYGLGAEKIALKAVLTPANAFWSSNCLYEELQKEREAIVTRGASKKRNSTIQ